MARGGRGRAKGPKGHGGKQPTGIEKYGGDSADEALNLIEDGDASEADDDEDIINEEEVLEPNYVDDDDEEGEVWQKNKKNKKKLGIGTNEEDEDIEAKIMEEERRGATTKGWQGYDFYGGDSLGDESDAASDEDFVMEEARRLEELRAKRLAGDEQDILLSLTGPKEESSTSKSKQDKPAASIKTGGAAAQFDTLFGADAEHGSVPRDISQLSETKRRSLVKKEAPELVPLLTDFKEKLAGLKELLPLLKPSAMSRVPKSGAAYLEAKASLLLNTLANLSFYLLLRAEGGAVQAHPVVSQLVWLRQLHEQIAPLDKRLAPRLKKALRVAKKVCKEETGKEIEEQTPPDEAVDSQKSARPLETPIKKVSLREKIEKLRAANGTGTNAGKDLQSSQVMRSSASTKDLFRLPARRRSIKAKEGDVPEDLDEVDPMLGMWAPSTNLGENITSMQQHLQERAARAKAEKVSADLNVEARPRRARTRVSESASLEAQLDMHDAAPAADGDKEDDEDEDELVKTARSQTQKKKEQKAAKQAELERLRVERQFKPVYEIDGRRKTSKRILDNRGLVRVRKKTAGNARVTNRKRYEQATKKRRGAVQEMREAAADGTTYAGEATGVRSHLRKSQKLG